MLSDEWLQRYRLLENFTAKWNGNGNAYDRGDYNSSFALRAVELKTKRPNLKVFCQKHAIGIANSEDPKGAVLPGSVLFGQTYLSKNLGSLRYIVSLYVT